MRLRYSKPRCCAIQKKRLKKTTTNPSWCCVRRVLCSRVVTAQKIPQKKHTHTQNGKRKRKKNNTKQRIAFALLSSSLLFATPRPTANRVPVLTCAACCHLRLPPPPFGNPSVIVPQNHAAHTRAPMHARTPRHAIAPASAPVPFPWNQHPPPLVLCTFCVCLGYAAASAVGVWRVNGALPPCYLYTPAESGCFCCSHTHPTPPPPPHAHSHTQKKTGCERHIENVQFIYSLFFLAIFPSIFSYCLTHKSLCARRTKKTNKHMQKNCTSATYYFGHTPPPPLLSPSPLRSGVQCVCNVCPRELPSSAPPPLKKECKRQRIRAKISPLSLHPFTTLVRNSECLSELFTFLSLFSSALLCLPHFFLSCASCLRT